MADMQIESHEDDSVTLTLHGLKAHITAESHRDAWEAAHALASILSVRVDLAKVTVSVQWLHERVREIERNIVAVDRGVAEAVRAARDVSAVTRAEKVHP